MSQFVLVATGVSNVDFEKAMEMKIKSGEKVKFVPQGGTQHAGAVVISQGMASVKPSNGAPEVLNNVRFEWDNAGVEFGADIIKALAGLHVKSQAAGGSGVAA